MRTRRFISSIVFFVLIFFTPWWFSFLLGIFFLIIYQNFWELLLGAIIIDLSFGTPLSQFGGFTMLLSIISLLFILIRQMLARRVFDRAYFAKF